ncbi:hypothetical protein vBAcoSR7M_40 [Alteromonas phage vB_AcoS-R7M]|uniref:Uncharacterized protein n=1 Tax=Alteromonas phage vB_AcoS-R7M TaxID=2729541 RepID=A0A6M3YN77_9CAUD|nr:tail protein [Alteromonas phage vB_AcoS-R7M]QJI53362.1 hypothetical protein vBAcoSR7M_40 [Alteromonas phage vB_AcoS-R7M]
MSFLSPTIRLPNQEGSRLDDLNPSPIGYGNPITRIWGTKRVTTKALDQFPIVETTHVEQVRSGGKGGGSTTYNNTTYTYSATFAVLICDKPIAGVRRIWMNGKLFFEDTPYQSGDVLNANRVARNKFNIYYGSQDQDPDPVLQAVRGDRCPAYRGRSYIVFKDIELAEAGNRIPSVDVEVIEYGVGENGLKPPYPFDTPLSRIVGDLCLSSGFKTEEFDVTQLTQKVKGFSVEGVTKASEVILDLMELFHFYPVDDGEKLVFQQQPTPIYRKEHNTNCLINEDGYISNAYHSTLGRQGYFPAEAGTSEGQFIMLRAAIMAYNETGDQRWRDLVDVLVRPLDKMYNQPIPATTDTLYVPHWLFVVKNAVTAQSNTLNYTLKMTLNGLDEYRGFIPNGYPGYADRIVSIVNAYPNDGTFTSWDNPFAGLIGHDGYGAPLRTGPGIVDGQNGTWIYYPSNGNGQINIEMNLIVIYDFGRWLEISENMEAWPHWRPMEQGELACAVDTLPWALECYELLETLTGDAKWTAAKETTKNTIDTVFDVDDGRNWIAKTAGSPFNTPGTYISSSRAGFSEANVIRNSDLTLDIVYPEGSGEAQFGRGITDFMRASDTHISVTYTWTKTMQSVVAPTADEMSTYVANVQENFIKIFLQSGNNVSTATRYFYMLNQNDGVKDIPLSSFKPLKMEASGMWIPDESAPALGASVTIDVVGLIYDGTTAAELKLERYRPTPEIQLPYTPGASPFTANTLSGTLIDWRGAPGVGYQDAMTWVNHNQPAKLAKMLDFIEDSQDEFESRYGSRGPFIPAYVWDRFDRQATGAANNTWTFDWVDPNSEWIGYTARTVNGCAMAGYKASSNRASAIASDFINWLNSVWTDHNKFIVTNLPETIRAIGRSEDVEVDEVVTVYNGYVYQCRTAGTTNGNAPTYPQTLYATVNDGTAVFECVGYSYGTVPAYGSYDEPHAASLFLRGAAYLHKSGYETTNSLAIVQRCWNYLERLWSNSYGEVDNTWSHNSAAGEWFGFWSGEIVTTLSLLLGELDSVRSAAGISAATINSRLSDHMGWISDKVRVVEVPNLLEQLTDGDMDVTRIKESELPRKVELTFVSNNRNGDTDTRAIERRSARSVEKEDITTDLVLTGDEALKIIYVYLSARWMQRIEWEMELMTTRIQPGDVREYEVDGVIHQMQFTDVDIRADGYSKVKALKYDPSVWTLSAMSSGDPITSIGIDSPSSTIPQFLDIPLIDSENDGLGYYTYAIPTKATWNGGYLLASENDTTYAEEATYIGRPPYGVASTALLGKKHELIDTESRLTVSMSHGELAAITDADFYSGANLALIGNEIINFRDVQIISSGVYELSHLRRGLKGTQREMYSHGEGERFVLLTNALSVAYMPESAIGVNRYYKGLSIGQTEDDVDATQYAIQGIKMKPLEPLHLKGRKLASEVVVTWIRQTRYSATWRDNADAPLGENSELYNLYLLDAPSGNVLYSYTTDSPQFTAERTLIDSLYGSPTAQIHVRVCQVSDIVGDGYYSEITI